jgi:hypothetical protein
MKLTGVAPDQEGLVLSTEPILSASPGADECAAIQDIPIEPESPEAANGQSDFRQCLSDLRGGWESMTPRSRLIFLGSGVVSAAIFGYVTVKCGPIPSLRKMIAGLPEYAGPENRAWLKSSALNVLAAVKRSVDPEAYSRRRAGILAGVVMAAANFSPAGINPMQTLPQTAIISPSDKKKCPDRPYPVIPA